jgi:aminotransferase
MKCLKEIAELAVEKDLYVLTDEVYQDFIYGSTEYFSIATCPGMRERTVIVDSFSKTYAMTGWRCGFALAPSQIIGQMVKIQENVVSCVNTPTQIGAIAALNGPQDAIHAMVEEYDINRKFIIQEINRIPALRCVEPHGAFYAFINISDTGLNSREYAIRLLKEAGVVTVPGTAFGEAGEGFIRLSYVIPGAAVREGIKRIKMFTEKILSEK